MIWLLLPIFLVIAACGGGVTSTSAGETPGKVKQAEGLLAEKSPEAFSIYAQHITSVQLGDHNGVDPGSGVLTLQQAFIDQSTLPYLASALAHDAYHRKHQLGCTIEEEAEVISWQIGVLADVGGSAYEMNQLRAQIGFHSCANNTVPLQ